jgi:hypothetical protein
MRLFGIEDESRGLELWSFECPKCHHIQTQIGKAGVIENLEGRRAT